MYKIALGTRLVLKYTRELSFVKNYSWLQLSLNNFVQVGIVKYHPRFKKANIAKLYFKTKSLNTIISKQRKLLTTDSGFYLNRCLHNLVNCISCLSRPTSIENLFGERATMELYLKCQILFLYYFQPLTRSSPPEVFLWKDLLKICGIFTGEHPYRKVNYHTKIGMGALL